MELEKLIIASILSEPDSAGVACEIVNKDMFSVPEKGVFEAIEQITTSGGYVDIFILSNALNGLINAPASYLANLANLTSSANRLSEYCYLLKEKYVNKLINQYFVAGAEMAKSADIDSLLKYAQSGMDNIYSLITSTNAGFQHISVLSEMAVKKAEKRVVDKAAGKEIGVPTGLRALTKMTNGFKGGELVILAARPAMGKSAMMLHFAKAAANANIPVCMYSLEMSAVSLADRMLMSIVTFDYEAYKSGDFQEWDRLMFAQDELSKLPIYIDANPKVSLAYIRNHSRLMKAKDKCGVVFIDYLQLADVSSNEKNRNREQEIAQATRSAKILAKELDVPVILLSQLSRAVEGRAEKRPQLSDLRESGAIEQDADIVMFLYRAEYYHIDSIELFNGENVNSKGVGEVIIAKNREGATGDVAFRYNENLTQITNF